MPALNELSHAAIAGDAPDATLVALAVDGSPLAFERIMRRYNRRLYRTARSILKDDSEAEDALQDAYMHAWRGLAGFRRDALLSTWLVRIVVNEALGRLRRKSAQIIPLDSLATTADGNDQAALSDNPNLQPEYTAMRTELRKLMEARIDLLPEAFRTVFVMRAIEDMSVEEVSQALEIPEPTVRTRFFRARSLLREGLANDIDVTLEDAFSFGGAHCDRIVSRVLARMRAEAAAPEKD